MKKTIVSIGAVLLWVVAIQAKSVILPELMKPAMMLVKHNKLYVLEKTTVYIYSLKDFTLLKKFGREGEGPREFKARPFGPPMTMSFLNNTLVVNSNNKLSYFDEGGNYLKERKAPPNLVFYQIRDKFVAIGPSPDRENRFRISLRLFDENFDELRILYHSDVSVNPRDGFILPMAAMTYNPVYGDKIVCVVSPTDFIINILNQQGEKIRTIEKNYKKIPVDQRFKDDCLSWFKNESIYKQFYDSIKGNIHFRDHYPAIKDIHVADGFIHVLTHRRRGSLWECILLDLEGKELGKVFIPLSRTIPFTYYALLYSVENGRLYSLVEDDEEEVWRLHIIKTR